MAMNKGHPPVLFSICEIRPHLFIAGYNAVEERKVRQLGITHCVDATNLPKTLRIPGVKYLVVEGLEDTVLADVRRHFQPVADFVGRARETGGRALIYCAAGISRAASLCIMTLVINEGLSLREAYQHVLQARPIIAPNYGFWRQMIEWERENRGTASVQLLKGMRMPIPDVYLHRSQMVGDRVPAEERERRAVGRPFDDGGRRGGRGGGSPGLGNFCYSAAMAAPSATMSSDK